MEKPKKSRRGGKRPGAGRPPSVKNISIEKVDDVRRLARHYTERAIKVLIAIAENDEAPESARVSAANSLLDRGHGRPASIGEGPVSTANAITDLLKQVDGMSKGVPSKVIDGTLNKSAVVDIDPVTGEKQETGSKP